VRGGPVGSSPRPTSGRKPGSGPWRGCATDLPQRISPIGSICTMPWPRSTPSIAAPSDCAISSALEGEISPPPRARRRWARPVCKCAEPCRSCAPFTGASPRGPNDDGGTVFRGTGIMSDKRELWRLDQVRLRYCDAVQTGDLEAIADLWDKAVGDPAL